jgi:hypothetical protein
MHALLKTCLQIHGQIGQIQILTYRLLGYLGLAPLRELGVKRERRKRKGKRKAFY